MRDIKTIAIPTPYGDVAANLILPPNFNETKTSPTVVSAHPVGSCKELTLGNIFGEALAEAGFLVCAFDASFQGNSGGGPRSTEDPGHRVGDFSYVVDHLVTLDYVDADNIGFLGICGGGGYTTAATMVERFFKALVTITCVNLGRLMKEGFSDFDPVANLEKIAEQRTKQARGGEENIYELLPVSNDAAREAGITDIDITDATDYYRTDRGKKPRGVVTFNQASMATLGNRDAFLRVETLLTQPVMVVYRRQARQLRCLPQRLWSCTALRPVRPTVSSSSPRAGRTTSYTTSPSRCRSRSNS